MKRLLVPIFCMMLSVSLSAQVGDQINYQAVARNMNGDPLRDQAITIRLSVREATPDGLIVFQETRKVSTNRFGMVNIAIGSEGATNVSGTLNAINWANGMAKYLQVEIDPSGGNKMSDMGTGRLQSVPYAMYAGKANPTGLAGGDLTGYYPNPAISKLKGVALSDISPLTGQVLKFDGTQWKPGDIPAGNNFSLPFSSVNNTTPGLLTLTNNGSGEAFLGINASVLPNVSAITGSITATNAGSMSSGIKGIHNGSGAEGMGIWGQHAGSGVGVYGISPKGFGVKGESTEGNGLFGSSSTGVGIIGTSTEGTAGLFDISNPNSYNDALFASNSGYGNGLTAVATLGNGVFGIANDLGGAGVFGVNNAGGEAVVGRGFSNSAAAITGRNDGSYAGVRGANAANNGTGVLAQANVDGASNGNALVASLEGPASGNTAVFQANGANVARIDHTGKGFFNGGTQIGGADVAELFEVTGTRSSYEPGDVLVISKSSDRKMERSTKPYSMLVAGVYATKPGVMLTEQNAEQDKLQHMVPLGVIGVIPTKVCLEGGPIERGDLLVTSSTPGVAMKADIKKLTPGQSLGKALQEFNGKGVGLINVLVSVK